jgi:hypothetical protein
LGDREDAHMYCVVGRAVGISLLAAFEGKWLMSEVVPTWGKIWIKFNTISFGL